MANNDAKNNIPEAQTPDRATIRQMLDSVEAVTKGRFYEDPNPVASPVEMFLIRDGRPGGEPFAELSVREKVQVLWDYTPSYEERGIRLEQMEQVFRNIILGDKPRAQWLDGAGLNGQPAVAPPTMQELSEALRSTLPEIATPLAERARAIGSKPVEKDAPALGD